MGGVSETPCVPGEIHKLGGNFGPEKKKIWPPPQIPRKHPSAARPSPARPPPPLLAFSIKAEPPPLRGASDSAFSSPGAGKNKKYPKRPPSKVSSQILKEREPPLTLRRENQYLYFGRSFPCMPGPFSCSTALFVYHSHRAGPVLQEFGLVLRVGVRHSTSVLRPLPWG